MADTEIHTALEALEMSQPAIRSSVGIVSILSRKAGMYGLGIQGSANVL